VSSSPDGARTLHHLDELVDLVRTVPGLYVRYSNGPDADEAETSVDYESGLPLPGLSVNRLDPQPWWTRSLEDWLARQLCQYLHLSDRSASHQGWVLAGEEVGRGPDDEPLVADVRPMAILHEALLQEAYEWYTKHFDAGKDRK
jgi:hypothetical protein